MTITTIPALLDMLPESIGKIHSSMLSTDRTFQEIAGKFAHNPGTVVLMSGGNADCAHYNILAISPRITLRATLTHAVVEYAGTTFTVEADPLTVLKFLVKRYQLPAGAYPSPLCAGLLGYLSYDCKDCIEVLPRTSVDDIGLPHLYMVLPSVIIIEDCIAKSTTLHITSFTGDTSSIDEQITAVKKTLDDTGPLRSNGSAVEHPAIVSCFTRDTYMQSVDAIRDYIVRGHVYQVNMSQRFETSFSGDPFELFTKLISRNPAPFFAYVNAGDHQIVSSSPERFIELRGNHVETRPIKGTRRRGTTSEEDNRLREELFSSRKDDAELSMIVDLMRNDIGKVCRAGSVVVSEHKRVEAYDNVFHLLSIIRGILDDDKDAIDLIYATFPGGSITGCPKIRAMEVIDELEPVRRHIYTGSIGYISFHNTMDLSIAIRTATIIGNRLLFSVGGGVVYDSDPADEYEETLHKGHTLMSGISNSSSAGTTTECQKKIAWCNGIFKPLGEISVSVNDEGFLYGYGIFETLRVQNGRILRLEQHLDRFNQSWRICFGAEPPDVTWDVIIREVVKRCELLDTVAVVKILAAAGDPSNPWTKTLLVTARAYTHRLLALKKEGLELAVYPQGRHTTLSSHKTMNYMASKMANDWAKQQGADEAVILNADGSVSETATANILCKINGRWYRPKSPYAFPGTMEKAVGEYLEQSGTIVESVAMSIDELKNADRVFLTNALMGIVPVNRIDTVHLAGDPEHVCASINMKLIG